MPNNSRAQSPFPGPATLDGYQQISGTCSEGDMVRLRTGNLIRFVSIANVPTVGFPLQFFLVYNSQSMVHGAVGHRWQHNLMMRLNLSVQNVVTFLSSQGRQFDFVYEAGAWKLTDDSFFFAGRLSQVGSTWRITLPRGEYYDFDSSGVLMQMVDCHGNATTLTYTLTGITVTEPEGRTLVLEFLQGTTLLGAVTDPSGNVAQLTYDEDDNLTGVVTYSPDPEEPGGCQVAFGHAIPSNHLITSRTDGKAQTYSYTFVDETGAAYNDATGATPALLSTVTDPDQNSIQYSYGNAVEATGDGEQRNFPQTTLTDARSLVWRYRFDQAGNLWRIIDPLGHIRRYYWDAEQALVYACGGFPNGASLGPRDNPNNSYWRSVYDEAKNLLLAADATGLVTQYEYNEQDLVTRVHPGRAHLGIQGNWRDHFGQDGFVLCSFLSAQEDVASLPAYVQGISLTGDRKHLDADVGVTNNWRKLMDPRVPDQGSSTRRECGFWHKVSQQGQDAEVQVTLSLEEAASFNLSVYSNSADVGQLGNLNTSFMPLVYQEQFGRDLIFSVVDQEGETGRQTVRIPNNAPGVWVTFPVRGDASHPIVLTVKAPQPDGAPATTVVEAILSALTFDPYESRSSRFDYNAEGDLTRATDALGNATVMTYEDDGRLSTLTTTVDSQDRTTSFFYEDQDQDGFKEVTRVVDALDGETVLRNDLNGNLVATTDANLHTTDFAYDLKNRLTTVTDALDHVTHFEYDPAGNLWKVTDAKGRVTELLYTGSNRTWKARQPLGDPLQEETVFEYDASGNLTQVTDPRGQVTQFQFDNAERPVATVFPDTARAEYAYDALDRLVAFTPPNGNQEPSLINVLGAPNLLRNPSAEEDDPNNPSAARYWSSYAPGGLRDSSTAPPQGGTYSLRMLATGNFQDWHQELANLMPGVPLKVRFWGLTNSSNPAMAEGGAEFPPASSGGNYQVSPTNEDASAYYQMSWAQLPFLRSPGVAGDAQLTQSHGARAHFGYSPKYGNNQTLHVDMGEVYGLGTAVRYDKQGRLSRIWTPDDSTSQFLRDRFGRVMRTVDPKGGETLLGYDALDRVVQVQDPEGNQTTLTYDEVGRLTSVTDGRGSVTTYSYDDLDRLIGILHPDSTSEAFTYYPNGNLETYKDNATDAPAVLCEFFYDDADRVTRILYHDDSTEVLFDYDEVGNVTSRTERNGDQNLFFLDALYRVKGTSRIPAPGSSTPRWGHASTFDANNNRLSLNGNDYGARYHVSRYQPSVPPDPKARFSSPTPLWSIPEADGFDSMNRMVKFHDQDGNETTFEYDIDGRRTRIVYPFPQESPLETQATYDVLGRLTRLKTVQGANTRLDLQYGYDESSNRVSQVTETDTFDYGLDKADRLVEECINRVVMRRPDVFARGEVVAAEVDPDEPAVRMLSLSDDFAGNRLSADRWRLAFSGGNYKGLEIRQADALEMTFPRGYTNYLYYSDETWVDTLTLLDSQIWAGAEHRVQLSGNFSVQVDFQSYQAYSAVSVLMGLRIHDQHLEAQSDDILLMALEHTPSGGHKYRAQITSAGTLQVNQSTLNSDESGRLRVRRDGTTVYLERWDSGAFAVLGTYTGFTTDAVYVSLYYANYRGVATVRFQDFTRSDQSHPLAATYTSPVYDAGRTPSAWNTISWTPTVPAGTGLQFKVAVQDSPDGPWEESDFEGPFTDPAGSSLPGTLEGRYMRYRAYLSGNGAATAEFSRVDVTFAGDLDPSLRVYDFDASGNMTGKTVETETPTGTTLITEVRDNPSWPTADRINNLNQLRRNDITDASGTTIWRYEWDTNGNLTRKSTADNSEVWDYTWSDDNRLTRVVKTVDSVVDVDVSYTYDSIGRMLTRKLSTDANPSTFEWDGWDLVREVDPDGVETVYYAPLGEILSFRRGSDVYQVHADALGSVRKITDGNGDVVAALDYGAWGETVQATGPLSACPFRFIGAQGVRSDLSIDLVYMRKRWYDPALSRFVSRDPVRSSNRYIYSRNLPTTYIDPLGLYEIADPRDYLPPEVLEAMARGESVRVSRDAFDKSLIMQTYVDVVQRMSGNPPSGRICVDYQREIFCAFYRLQKMGFLKNYSVRPYAWWKPLPGGNPFPPGADVPERTGENPHHNFVVISGPDGARFVFDPWMISWGLFDVPAYWTSLQDYAKSRPLLLRSSTEGIGPLPDWQAKNMVEVMCGQ